LVPCVGAKLNFTTGEHGIFRTGKDGYQKQPHERFNQVMLCSNAQMLLVLLLIAGSKNLQAQKILGTQLIVRSLYSAPIKI